ncbi:MAG: four helix bundle protein [Bacteroidales bacterium]|nr:four helix bundle protein [Bacteroidales bacterium]
MSENAVKEKSMCFAVRIVNLYKFLVEERQEHTLSKQILRCGTSIGANVSEALCAESQKDFIHKLHIALKEANETKYWLELMQHTGYINEKEADSMGKDLSELLALLTAIIKTVKTNINT